jgi:hypothetical protein
METSTRIIDHYVKGCTKGDLQENTSTGKNLLGDHKGKASRVWRIGKRLI